MKVTLSEEQGILFTSILFALFMFFIPISPSLKSIFFACSVGVILLTPHFNQFIPYAFNSLWGRASLFLLLYSMVACLWSPAPFLMQLTVVGKYSKLIYLPVLAVAFAHAKIRNLALNSYLAAMFVTCIISVLKSEHILTPGDPGEVFYNHIITGFMMGFAAYLASLYAFKYQGWIRAGYVFLFAIMSYQVLFINTGRTGYVMYFILMAFLMMQKLSIKKAVLGVVFLCALLGLVYHESPIMYGRVHDLLSDIKALKHNNANTSLGYRIQFHDYAQSLWEKNPVVGIGTGGFKYSFSQDNPVPSWGKELTDPHSQYWMTLAEQGVIGFVLLMFFLSSLLITSFQLTETKPIIWGILISFCIGSFSDTILCYSTAGYLLVVMSALCFGELIEQRRIQTAKLDNICMPLDLSRMSQETQAGGA
ncbi:O-antigen ligase family protein [Legionella worsleiensis]|uniref:O-antigen biosynthesis protein n=1 Tax=Legionella worsleiensis TaxID=45076 RepID=A0A0W1A3T9_9GAMM|nr:O-antigen ligase family protein [Legionella worsleiensis]KTD75944.1 O-antigen biosynthesis protein [Legionella worsleiensis]STY32957.1 O-antigen biosynthesis protein [Legionella worsleiensis]